ncbi:MAG TPA: flagellar hook capping FlgD N-terminal domain-containing protein [Acidimicrobiia bacterium]|nr:flagellar hook capping FlgD N-terminal domain-containing protein [Acidimicrobiia bacterium]
MTTINPVTGVPIDTNVTPSSNGLPQLDNTRQLDENTFLKLLVAQLKYQNPLQPTDPAAFMAQTAQFTQVEKLNQLVQMAQAQQTSDQMLLSSSLVGKTVTYDASGTTVKGVVTSVRLDTKNPPVLTVDGHDVQLTAVRQIDLSG